VLDPFCGTGVVLQEAALMGAELQGTDLEPRMIDFSRENLEWLATNFNLKVDPLLQAADATSHKWQPPLEYVVTETYLGQPLSGQPAAEKLQSIATDCDTIITKFLANLRPQLPESSRLCVAVPAWRTAGGFKHLSLLDRLESLGYNRLKFQHATWQDLIYHREDQIVARELLVLTVK
jgi:tRNA G10  N-methylase Trm11